MTEMTDLLRSAQSGDPQASSRLFELVYADMKRMAHSRLYRSGGLDDLDTTSLVHESFLKLSGEGRLKASDRPAFFGYVARVMRSVVIDHVRERQARKRGSGDLLVTLTTGIEAEAIDDRRLMAMGAALDVLQRLSPQFHELVELRYFAGLSIREVAEARGTSTRTVEREWEKARAFLLHLMEEA